MAGQSTQMIVGATESSDATILSTASSLYNRHDLRRVYYTAFSPIPHGDGRLPTKPPPLVREHRLYQADWLVRFYNFDVNELTTSDSPNLDLKIDPKLAWALRHREFFPVDINRDEKFKLLRVPGLGVRNVNRILKIRRFCRIRMEDLPKLRVSLAKLRPWILTADHNPDVLRIDRAPRAVQLNLFESATTARSGEL
jgi:predicted DNA-binding helix-hairpin-helix protein